MSGRRRNILDEVADAMQRCVRRRGLSSEEATTLSESASELMHRLVPTAFDVAAEEELGSDLSLLSIESLQSYASSRVVSPAVTEELEKRRADQADSARLMAAIDAAPSLAIAMRVFAHAHPRLDVYVDTPTHCLCDCAGPPYRWPCLILEEKRQCLLRKVIEAATDAEFVDRLHGMSRGDIPGHLSARIEERAVTSIAALASATGADWRVVMLAAYDVKAWPIGATVGAMVDAALVRAVPTAVPAPADRDVDAAVWAQVLADRRADDTDPWWETTFASSLAAVTAHLRRVAEVVDWDVELSSDVKRMLRYAGIRRGSGDDRDRDRGSDSGDDRDQDRGSGDDRDQDRGSGDDRDQDRGSGDDRDRGSGDDRDRGMDYGSDEDRDRDRGRDEDRGGAGDNDVDVYA